MLQPWGFLGLLLLACHGGIPNCQASLTPADLPDHNQYAGYKVLRLYPSSDHHMRNLILYEKRTHGQIQILNEVTRSEGTRDARQKRFTMDVLSSPDALAEFAQLVEYLQIPYDTLVPDLRGALRDHMDMNGITRDRRFGLDKYNRYDEIVNWLFEMQQGHYDVMSVIQIGSSWEKRPMYVVKISTGNNVPAKPAIWMDAGIHSNEWIGPATLIYLLDRMLNGRHTDSHTAALVEDYDWYIMPVFNVDGYKHSWTKDRLWRKSRSSRSNSTRCVGVDMNRNWRYQWGVAPGVSHDPCSRIYGGPGPESEPEVQTVIQFLRRIGDALKVYVAFHSYSQFWMTPYSYSKQAHPDNIHTLLNVSLEVTNAIHQVHAVDYMAGSVSELVGEASGSSIDFTHAELGVPFSFGVELRDSGQFGTLLPPSEIIPTGEEIFAGIRQMAASVKRILNNE